jgi:hypothetical protein
MIRLAKGGKCRLLLSASMKAITTEDTKSHEGKPCKSIFWLPFVAFVVDDFLSPVDSLPIFVQNRAIP